MATCAHCAALPLANSAYAFSWTTPPRFSRPELDTDEGGLWAQMDREETRLRRSPFVDKDPALRDYLLEVTCRLVGDHCPDLRIYLMRVPHFNASMAPNGMMQIWTGLLLRVENEAQLAAVIGHELGHYLQRHSLSRLRDTKARAAFMTVLAPFGLVGAIGQLASAAGAFGFSREQEREADAIGLMLMKNAGYDPKEAARVWENLHQEATATAGGDPLKTNVLFATHPPSEARKQNLIRLAESSVGGFVGVLELEEKLKKLQIELLEDELQRGQYDETLVLLNRMLVRHLHRSDLHYFRGETRRLRAKESDLDLAMADLDRAIHLGNEPGAVYRAKGYIHQQRGQMSQAREAFAIYLERVPHAVDAGLINQYITQEKS